MLTSKVLIPEKTSKIFSTSQWSAHIVYNGSVRKSVRRSVHKDYVYTKSVRKVAEVYARYQAYTSAIT